VPGKEKKKIRVRQKPLKGNGRRRDGNTKEAVERYAGAQNISGEKTQKKKSTENNSEETRRCFCQGKTADLARKVGGRLTAANGCGGNRKQILWGNSPHNLTVRGACHGGAKQREKTVGAVVTSWGSEPLDSC